jgi:hypothetical protein
MIDWRSPPFSPIAGQYSRSRNHLPVNPFLNSRKTPYVKTTWSGPHPPIEGGGWGGLQQRGVVRDGHSPWHYEHRLFQGNV